MLVASTTLTPEQRTLRARIGAYALHAQGKTSTRAGTDAFLGRFVREVEAVADAHGEALTPDEVTRRALHARRAYFARLALASSRARTKKKAGPDRDSGPAQSWESRTKCPDHDAATVARAPRAVAMENVRGAIDYLERFEAVLREVGEPGNAGVVCNVPDMLDPKRRCQWS